MTPTRHQEEPVPLTWLFNFVKPYRVRITSTYGGDGHVPTSYHYRYRAVDCAGRAEDMEQLARAAVLRASSFREVFYDPLGKYVKNGVVKLGHIGGHKDHVHLAR